MQMGFSFHKRKNTMDLLKRFKLLNCESTITRMNMNEKLQDQCKEFQKLGKRFDLFDSCQARYCIFCWYNFQVYAKSHKTSFWSIKRVLRYIAGIIDYRIQYWQVTNFRLCEFTDGDWASSLDDGKKILASVFTLGSCANTEFKETSYNSFILLRS